ncbi:hypothetical protein ALFP_1620 [Alcaligenes faecalis]|nr:hypothetical protein ALFP_1620 [Alcaligenes faecalis]
MTNDDQVSTAMAGIGGLGRKWQKQSTQSAKQSVFQKGASQTGKRHGDTSAE